jgi:ABC-type multidrug transport system fused ATPase/permease subunit
LKTEELEAHELPDASEKNQKGILKDEEKETGNVDYKIGIQYFSYASKSLGGKFSVFIIIFLHILINLCTSSLSFYLAYALSDFKEDNQGEKEHRNIGAGGNTYFFVLMAIMFTCIIVTVIGKYISNAIFMSISRNMHRDVVRNLLHTKMQFFDENTSGRIINRLSKDVAVLDLVVFNFLEMIDYIIKCSFSVAFIVGSSPVTLIVVVFQLFYFYRLRKTILNITRDCFRLK